MEFNNGKCTLCEQEQKVFSTNTDLFTKQIQDAFFARNKEDYSLEFSEKLALCIVCCQKLQISFDFKKSYDQMCNRNHGPHKNKCFFCENRVRILVDMDVITSGYNKKLRVFLNSVIVRHNYDGLSACIKCAYDLNIWWEIRTCIYSLMNLPENTPTTNTAVENNMYCTPTIKRSARQAISSKYGSRNKQRLSTLRERRKKLKWKMYIKKRLRHIKTANEIINSSNLSFEDVDEIFPDKPDEKLFNQKAYVSISINSQISSRVLRKSSAHETIIIDDSDDESISSPTSDVRSSSRSSKNSKNSKTPFKIKFSPSFSKSLTLRTKHNYTCSVCDKGFSVRCDYLLHLLKHEKMESVIINVTRHELPARANVDEFENPRRKTNKMSIPSGRINQLLAKWVGEHAANTFDESDKENGGNVNNTVEGTDSCNDLPNIVEEDSGHGEGNDNDNTKSNDSDVLVTKIGDTTDHSNELTKSTPDTNDHDRPSEILDEVVSNHTLEPTGEKLNETSTCNENAEVDGDGNLEPNNAENDKGEDNTEAVNGENENENENENQNQNEVEVESSKDEESSTKRESISENNENVQGITDLTENISSQDEHVTQENEPNSTHEETSISENVASEKSRNISLSLKRKSTTTPPDNSKPDTYEEFSSDESNSASGNAKIVSCEELLSILEGDDDSTAKTAEKSVHFSNKENVSGDEVDENVDNGSTKRKRVEDESDETPKRKRVRFASEKIIMTPDKSILLEKVSEGDDIVVDE